MSWFRRIERGLKGDDKRDLPDGLWRKCDACGEIMYERVIERNVWSCMKCGHHFIISGRQYASILADKGTFEEMDAGMRSTDPLGFKDSKKYVDRIRASTKKTGLNEAVVSGTCAIGDHPAVVVSSSGGARMQEGILSLMQMAKTSAWLTRLSDQGLPYISILTHPTTGGVTASFSMLGDIIIAEPRALIGFAGPRVIQQTINQDLPEGFQRAEFLLDHGQVDMVVPRPRMKQTVVDVLDFFGDKERPVEGKGKPAILKTPPHIEVKADGTDGNG